MRLILRRAQEIWKLNTIPAAGEPGADTWPNEESRKHGGGPLWVTGTYDPNLNLMYWGTGNPHPVLAGTVREGANLYTCTILAIDPDTGKIKWFFQPSPHDTRDWDAVETNVLFDATGGWQAAPNCCHTRAAMGTTFAGSRDGRAHCDEGVYAGELLKGTEREGRTDS